MQFHSTDLMDIYGPGDLTDALVNFATNLDPNGPTLIDWPAYTVDSPALLTIQDGDVTPQITNDDFRADAMHVLTRVSLAGSS